LTVRLSELTWQEARDAAAAERLVIVPIGSTEAHGPHLPLDVDTHQAEYVAERLAERVGALVAPVLPYSYAVTWLGFAGTMSLSAETFQQVLIELCQSLVRNGFRRLMLLNGHRPNGTSVDVAARRVVDALPADASLQISALSYWEPGASAVHALRQSRVGGMGHACELETSFQLATRPELVHMERLDGVQAPLVGWDLVAPGEPARTYEPWPAPSASHPAIFGDPTVASADSGERFLEAILDGLVEFVRRLEAGHSAYGTRIEEVPAR
jgi:creatinine amidohydrolase